MVGGDAFHRRLGWISLASIVLHAARISMAPCEFILHAAEHRLGGLQKVVRRNRPTPVSVWSRDRGAAFSSVTPAAKAPRQKMLTRATAHEVVVKRSRDIRH